MTSPRKAIIVSISSDIGYALSAKLLGEGWDLWGTYRTASPQTEELTRQVVRLFKCDVSQPAQIAAAAEEIAQSVGAWDALVVAPGAQEPIGLFHETAFADWAAGVQVNLMGQLQIMHALLPSRNRQCPEGPIVLFFAGGGTNNAPIRYSAYTISKIALIKMCELLQAEIPEMRFSIVGPGWVKTKIHLPTFDAPERAGESYARTRERFAQDNFVSMERVVDSCHWVLNAPRAAVGGRNFSTANDAWGSAELVERLTADPNMYKLRRYGNDWQPRA
jgi:NAD(P)-dependent dehydrogenase (short-subunit alcohol dehydrogenase family)